MINNTDQMIEALVINLPDSVDRFEFQKKQLTGLNIPFQHLTAVSTRDIDAVLYESLANGWERKLRLTEVACFLSHKKAWEYVHSSGKPMLILEDDALLACNAASLLIKLLAQPCNVDFVNLETHNRKKVVGNPLDIGDDHFQLKRLYQDRTGAAAYILYPSGAQKLLNKAQKKLPGLADAFISSTYELDAWQVCPAAAIQLDQCPTYNLSIQGPAKSTITPTDPSKPLPKNATDAITFKYRRWVSQLRMGLRQLSVIGRSRRILINIDTDKFRQP